MKTLFRATMLIILSLTLATCVTAQTVAQTAPTSNAPPTASASGNQSAITWTLVTQSGIPDYVESIAYGNGRFVAAGSPDNYLDDGRRSSNEGMIAYSNVQGVGGGDPSKYVRATSIINTRGR